ncbi:MAG: hypothetical protein A2X78_01620 [Gammaproteobacteria bacterium GWE2_37_16]|nr:MAG: hypothetical protein A2X78_01620 [Gammaproteobacteria bacterium GWE2_37_16]
MKKDQFELPKLEELIEKVTQAKKKNPLDLSSDQDLSIAVMNLISIEEHCFFSGTKTENTKYFDLILEVREMRKDLLKKLVHDSADGSERWCISKHLLASSMRLMEVGTKQLDLGNKDEAHDFFHKAYELYAMFWGLNLDLLGFDAAKKIDHAVEVNVANKEILIDDDSGEKVPVKTRVRSVWGKLVQKAIDCCLE